MTGLFIVGGLIFAVAVLFVAGSMKVAGDADEAMESMMDRDLPPEALRLRDRERSADLD